MVKVTVMVDLNSLVEPTMLSIDIQHGTGIGNEITCAKFLETLHVIPRLFHIFWRALNQHIDTIYYQLLCIILTMARCIGKQCY